MQLISNSRRVRGKFVEKWIAFLGKLSKTKTIWAIIPLRYALVFACHWPQRTDFVREPDDVTVLELLPHCWSFVGGILRPPMGFPHKWAVIWCIDDPLVIGLSKLLNKRWFETPWRSCDVTELKHVVSTNDVWNAPVHSWESLGVLSNSVKISVTCKVLGVLSNSIKILTCKVKYHIVY